jgi:hypothetical protein
MRDEAAAVLAPMGLRLSEEKTKITHIDEGLDFLGWRIQRHRKRGTNRHCVYTYPARKAIQAVTGKVRTACQRMDTNQPLEVLLLQLNRMLRGWCAYFRPGVSSATFKYLSAYTWRRVIEWLRRKPRRITVKELRRRYCGGGWWPGTEERQLFNPAKVRTTRYRYRGAAPHSLAGHGMRTQRAVSGLVERPVLGNGHAGCGRRLGETHRWKHQQGVPSRPHYYLLEDAGFEVMLVNARHVKNLPGRKTDLLRDLAGPTRCARPGAWLVRATRADPPVARPHPRQDRDHP